LSDIILELRPMSAGMVERHVGAAGCWRLM
jgi:hypothetical protein